MILLTQIRMLGMMERKSITLISQVGEHMGETLLPIIERHVIVGS